MKDYIDKIVKNGKQEDMDCLEDILIDSLYSIKENDYRKFKEYKNKIKGMAYDYKIDEEMAKEIVEDMKPLGEYWSMEQVKGVMVNDTHRLEDMYVVLNSLANDYKDVVSTEETETYIKMAHAWIDDIDAKNNKIWKYFVEN